MFLPGAFRLTRTEGRWFQFPAVEERVVEIFWLYKVPSLRLAGIFFLHQQMLALTIYSGFLLKGETSSMTVLIVILKQRKNQHLKVKCLFY